MKILKLFYWISIGFIVIVGLILIATEFSFGNGLRLYTIESGSMGPTIKIGSLILSIPYKQYYKGDIIVFKSPSERKLKNPKFTTTHRIYDIVESNNTTDIITKGDANKIPDIVPITKDLILGKVIIIIPLIGYLVSFSKTQAGFIILIIIPATIIIYSELMNIKNETLRLIKERIQRKSTLPEKIEEKIGEEIITVEKEIIKDVTKIGKKKRWKK